MEGMPERTIHSYHWWWSDDNVVETQPEVDLALLADDEAGEELEEELDMETTELPMLPLSSPENGPSGLSTKLQLITVRTSQAIEDTVNGEPLPPLDHFQEIVK